MSDNCEQAYSINKAIPALSELVTQSLEVWRRFRSEVIENELMVPLDVRRSFRVDINLYLLTAALGDAQIALSRWADFHLAGKHKCCEEARPDNHKLGGFVAKWIAKRRPIQVLLTEDGERNDTYPSMPEIFYRINAVFAAAVLRSYIEVEHIPKEMLTELIYRLHFREPEGLDLAYFAYTMEKFSDMGAQGLCTRIA